MPGVANLMIVDRWQIVRRIEAECSDVEAADCTQQGVGRDHAIALRQNLAGPGGREILL